MTTRRDFSRFGFGAVAAAAVLAVGLAGCGSMMPAASNMVAFTTQLRGANEVPPVTSPGSGTVDAAFNKDTLQLRWKVTYTGLTGPATMGHFHGPAAVGSNAGIALGWANPVTSGMDGSAILTAAQAADLMAGRWYANIHTAANRGGELRAIHTDRIGEAGETFGPRHPIGDRRARRSAAKGIPPHILFVEDQIAGDARIILNIGVVVNIDRRGRVGGGNAEAANKRIRHVGE